MSDRKTYWDGDGKYQQYADELQNLIPSRGEVPDPIKNKALERYREACNLYHEIFNNGCFNTTEGAKDLFGLNPDTLRRFCKNYQWDKIFEYTEPALDQIILEAVHEQLEYHIATL